jgi:hypothetical protein
MNVRINASSIKDREAARMWLSEVATLEHSIEDTFASINRIVRNRMNSS